MKFTYYPKTAAQKFGIYTVTPDNYSKEKKYMIILLGHGIGERGMGTLASLTKISQWGGWANLNKAVDKYGIIIAGLQTENSYERGEYDFAYDWAVANLPADLNNIWLWGNSLGWYGAGNQVFGKNSPIVSKLAGTINTVSGPYSGTAAVTNLVNAGIKYWGFTATNDTHNGTNPKYTRQVYDLGKAINKDAHLLVTEFPIGTFDDLNGHAHGGPLGRASFDGVQTLSNITRGIDQTLPMKMTIYQWMLSNPKGSIYQPPTNAFSGPKFDNVETPAPTPAPVEVPQPAPAPTPKKTVKRIGITISDIDKTMNTMLVQIFWEGSEERFEKVESLYWSDQSQRLDVIFSDRTKKSIWNTKEI
jgi:hypothetical protein